MKLSFSGKSDIGLIRKVNQDRWCHVHCQWGDLFVVADGLGHREGGQFASQTTVNMLKDKFSEGDPGEIPDFLRHGLEEINTVVYNQKISEYDNIMMGSTCVSIVVRESFAYLAHVGDSRAYYLHNGELAQMTKDHTLVQRMVDEGVISKQQAETHPQKNIVTEALGAKVIVNADISHQSLNVSNGDKFLLCSDGLWGLISHDDLYEILGGEKPKVATERLIDLAKRNGGYDNITVQVIHIVE